MNFAAAIQGVNNTCRHVQDQTYGIDGLLEEVDLAELNIHVTKSCINEQHDMLEELLGQPHLSCSGDTPGTSEIAPQDGRCEELC